MKSMLSLLLLLAQQGICQNTSPDFDKQPKLSWTYKTRGPVMGSPVVDDNTVYAGSEDGTLYALDKDKGTVKWTVPTYGPIRGSVCLDGDKLYFFSGNGVLYCRLKSSGKPVWRFQTAAGALGDRKSDFADYYHSSPVLFDGKIFFGAGDGNVYALNSANGQMLWRFETGGIVHTTPAIDQGKLFIGSYDGNLYALQMETGQLIWTFKTTGHRYFPRGEVMGNPVVIKGLVCFGARDFNFYALDENSGYCHWLKQFPKGWALPATPGDSVLYLGTSDDRLLYALNPSTGETRWKTDTKFNVFGGCALGNTMGYFGTLSGKLYGIDLKTGLVTWTYTGSAYELNRLKYLKANDDFRDDIGNVIQKTEDILNIYKDLGGIFSTPALTKDAIYFTTYDGEVSCLKRGD